MNSSIAVRCTLVSVLMCWGGAAFVNAEAVTGFTTELPFRYTVKSQAGGSDNFICADLNFNHGTPQLVMSLLNGETEWTFSEDMELTFMQRVAVFFFWVLTEDRALLPEIRQLAEIMLDSLCRYIEGKIPRTTLDLGRLASILSFRITQWHPQADAEELIPLAGYPRYAYRAGFFTLIIAIMYRMNNYTLTDRLFIERLNLLIKTGQNLVDSDAILDLGAGRGDIASALRKKGHFVTAVDNFDHPYFSNGIDLGRPPSQIIELDMYDALNQFDDHRILLLFNLVFENKLWNQILDNSGKLLLIFVHRGWRSVSADIKNNLRKEGIKERAMHIEIIDLAVPTVYGPLPAIAILSDSSLRKDAPQWQKRVEELKAAKAAVESLLQKQLAKNPRDILVAPSSESDQALNRKNGRRADEL